MFHLLIILAHLVDRSTSIYNACCYGYVQLRLRTTENKRIGREYGGVRGSLCPPPFDYIKKHIKNHKCLLHPPCFSYSYLKLGIEDGYNQKSVLLLLSSDKKCLSPSEVESEALNTLKNIVVMAEIELRKSCIVIVHNAPRQDAEVKQCLKKEE